MVRHQHHVSRIRAYITAQFQDDDICIMLMRTFFEGVCFNPCSFNANQVIKLAFQQHLAKDTVPILIACFLTKLLAIEIDMPYSRRQHQKKPTCQNAIERIIHIAAV